jgi:hypothetical protein
MTIKTFVKKQKMKTLQYLLTAIALGYLTSCEPKDDSTNPIPSGPVYGDTIAVKTGKGFSTLAILATNGAGGGANGGAYDDFGMVDMALLPDGKTLQMATLSTLTTQQDPLNNLERRAMDIETKSPLNGPTSNIGALGYASYSSSSAFTNRSFGYQRGTSKFFNSNYSVSNFGIVTGTVTGDFTYTRSATFANQPRVTNLGEVVEDLRTQTTPRLDGKSNNQIFFYYRKTNGTGISFYHQRLVNPDLVKSLVIRGGVVEPTKINDDKVLIFCLSLNQLFVAEAPVSGDNSQLNFVDSLALPAEWQSSNICTRQSTDGTSFGVVVGNSETSGSLSVMSAQYNVANKKFIRNITNLSIPGFNLGKVNFDIDETGNMYFDNWANNFQSDSTISIYKASGSSFSVVGQEDILKSGSVVNVRYLNGKVYAAVAYRYIVSSNSSSSKKFRMAVIKQD